MRIETSRETTKLGRAQPVVQLFIFVTSAYLSAASASGVAYFTALTEKSAKLAPYTGVRVQIMAEENGNVVVGFSKFWKKKSEIRSREILGPIEEKPTLIIPSGGSNGNGPTFKAALESLGPTFGRDLLEKMEYLGPILNDYGSLFSCDVKNQEPIELFESRLPGKPGEEFPVVTCRFYLGKTSGFEYRQTWVVNKRVVRLDLRHLDEATKVPISGGVEWLDVIRAEQAVSLAGWEELSTELVNFKFDSNAIAFVKRSWLLK